MSTGFIFPAFVSEYIGNEVEILNSYSDDFSRYLAEASEFLNMDLKSFSVDNRLYINNEIYAQYVSYIFGCSMANVLESRNLVPTFISGYSMGLYACLYCGHSISFTQGLELIRKAYDLVKETTDHLDTGMGSIVGLSLEDINGLIENDVDGVQVVNKNGTHSFLVSGIKSSINEVLKAAKSEGALHTSMLNVKSPYHTRMLDQASKCLINSSQKISRLKILSHKIVSALDQKVIQSENEIHTELVDNLNSNIDWLKTMDLMIGNGITQFVECGAGNSLYRIGKFMKGDFKIYPMNKLNKILK